MSLLVAQAAWGWPDLNVVKTGPAQAAPGDLINYTLTYFNSGPVDSTSVVLKDLLPSYVAVLTNTLDGGSLAGSTITWNLGTLSFGAGGSRSFQVRVGTNTPSDLSITNRAQIFGSEEEEPGMTNDNYSTLITLIINRPPVAQNDSYTVNEDTALVIPSPGVLANDSDPDGNPLQAILVSGPTHGTLTLNTDGSFTYTPATNYNGGDTFTYMANDGPANSGIATVTITVTPLNDPPVAVDDNYTVSEDITLLVPTRGVLGNDSDPDGDAFIALLEAGPAHGALILGTNGNFTYQPASNYTGSDSFTYRAFDGKTNSNIATVHLIISPVNDRPVAVNDAYTTPEDTALNISAPGVLHNDTDVDGDMLTSILASSPAHGTLTLSTNGAFTYVPANHYNGPDSFTYRAFDGRTNSENAATVTITVTPMNDAPVAVNDGYTTPEDTTLNVATPGVLVNDTDVDGDTLTAILVTNPAHGALTLNNNGSFSYQPATNYNGSDSFTYRASDGTSNSGIATVSITVTPVNDPPDAATDNYTALEDTVLTVAAPGVLGNDTDADGDTLTARLEGAPLHGTVTLDANGSFTYSPAADYFGPDSFTYFASDGQPPVRLATVNITVVPVNDPPAFAKGADQLVQQNAGPQIVPGWATGISPGPANESSQTVSFQVLSDNDALFAVQPAVAANGTLTFTPAANAYGVAVLRVIAHDDGGTANGGVDTSAPQTFALTVNAPPTVSISSPTNGAVFMAPASFNVIADAQDVDGTIASVEIFEGTNKLIEVTAGQPPVVARTNLPIGSYTFSATATDNLGARGTSAPVSVTVVERPPLTVLSALHYDPQTDFYIERVRITNPTGSTFDAVRVTIFNLTNTPAITVNNVTGYTNDIPYIQTYAAILPGSYADVTIEYRSPLRIPPNPILRPELVSPRSPDPGPVVGTPQNIQRGLMFPDRTFLVEFASLFNRIYVVQYSSDLLTWKAAEPRVTGSGGWIQWIDNGVPKTDGAPGAQPARFYRVILLP